MSPSSASSATAEVLEIAGHALELARIPGPGARAQPTLVFLHEGLGSVSTWRDVPARIAVATGLPALVYSRAGYGNSAPVTLPRPLDYMQHEGRVVLPALLERAGIDDALLIGHSDGASIALLYAPTAHGRARVRGLVLEAPHVFVEERTVAAIEQAAAAYRESGLRERLARHHAQVDVAFWGWNRAWLAPGFRDWNIESVLPAVRAPALLVQSVDDPYGTTRQLDAIARGSGGPVEQLLLEDCGHAPHRDRPEATLSAITDFVGALLTAA